MLLILLLASLATLTWAESEVPIPRDAPSEMPIRYDLKAPEDIEQIASRRMNMSSESGQRQIIYQTFIEMPLDHFDPQNNDTFMMRYLFSEEFFTKDDDPIFIMVGGEWDITPGFLTTGNMYEMAQENHGYMIYTEHRYYGQSLPFSDFTTENLRFLNVDQALADLAFFIAEIKKRPQFTNSKVILYGCSYAANMVTWFKQRYPHLVKGVIASSGPIKAEVDFQGYLKVVHDAFLSEGGEQCIDVIKQGVQETVDSMFTETGMQNLQAAYRLCNPLDLDDPLTVGYFAGGLITWSFSGIVQTANPGVLIDVCNRLTDFTFGITPMQRLGGFIAWYYGLTGTGCWTLPFQSLINTYSRNDNNRAWYYQTCTEYGYYQTAPKDAGTAFDPLMWLDVDFYVEVCKRAFTERFSKEFVNGAADRVNLIFGGLSPDANNTITIHGQNDPWRYLGVYDRDLKEGSPTFNVPRASHCFDIRSWTSTDTIRMTAVQQRVRRMIARWLADQD